MWRCTSVITILALAVPILSASGAFRGHEILSPTSRLSSTDAFVKADDQSNGLRDGTIRVVEGRSVLLDSVQVGSDAIGQYFAATACILVCLPVFFGVAVMFMGKRRVSPTSEENTVLSCARSPPPSMLIACGHEQQDELAKTCSRLPSSIHADASILHEVVAATIPSCPTLPLPEDDLHVDKVERSAHSHSWPLCPGLVVRQPGGITLLMNGLTCGPSDTVEFKRDGDSRDVVARAFVSEDLEGMPGGMVLESSLRLPIVLLDLQNADRNAFTQHRSDVPYITVFRASQVQALGPPEGLPFCTVQTDSSGTGFIMWRGASDNGDRILSVQVNGDGNVANVVDPDGKLLAATEVRSFELGPRHARLLHISSGADSCLIMIAILAAQRLS